MTAWPQSVWRLAPCLVLILSSASTIAHEIRPASIDITQTANVVSIVWRQPVVGDYSLALKPMLSSGWLDQPPDEQQASAQTLMRRWNITASTTMLEGQQLTVRGLERTLTDVLVTVHWRGGDISTTLLKPLANSMSLTPTSGSGAASATYLRLGFTHIMGGYDHLLYLLGLMLLVPGLRSLVAVITAFTLAHSLTLALSVTGWVQIATAPVEALIALSVLFVAVEIRHGQNGRQHFTHRYPWVIAFLFGLLHGLGFAAALRSIGFADDALAWPLLLFNIGIELGQLLFVAAALAIMALLQRWKPTAVLHAHRALALGIGTLAAWWFFERLAALGQTA
jgi:HupE / UreJ protein